MIADIKNKNPFNILIGLLLKYYRVQKRVTSKDMALMLNSGHSLYRLMESGASPLHPSKIYLLIEVFDNLFEENQNIEFENLSKFLIGGQYLDALVNRKKRASSRGLTYQEALQDFLGNSGSDFNKLFDNITGIFDTKTKEDDLNYLVNEKAPLELFDFLSLNNYEKTKTKQHKDEVVAKVYGSYSLQIDMILGVLEELSSHSPSHISDNAHYWEDKNKTKFTHLRGFYLKKEIVINEENFILFDYSYLFESNFKELKMVFVSNEKSDDLKEDFIKKLNHSRIKQNKKELTKNEKEKIHIKTISDTDIGNFQDLITENKGLLNTGLLAYWSFSMRNGNENGFIGYKVGGGEEYAFNIKYLDGKERVKKFDKKWNNIS